MEKEHNFYWSNLDIKEHHRICRIISIKNLHVDFICEVYVRGAVTVDSYILVSMTKVWIHLFEKWKKNIEICSQCR
jgi:hypothetical protein